MVRSAVFGLLAFVLMASLPVQADALTFGKGVRLTSGQGASSLTLGARLQTDFTLTSIKEAEGRAWDAGFGLGRARLLVTGETARRRLTYALQVSFDSLLPAIKDVVVDTRLVKRWLHLRLGRFKRPFSGPYLTPFTGLALSDRPLTDVVFGSGRDVGMLFHNLVSDNRFKWAFGVFNGALLDPVQKGEELRRERVREVDETDSLTPFQPTLVLRMVGEHGSVGHHEFDRKKGVFRWGLGAALLMRVPVKGEQVGSIQAQVDLKLKVRGFSLLGAAYVATEASPSARFLDQSFRAFGYQLTAAYLVGQYVAPALRFSHLIFEAHETEIKNVSLALNLFSTKLGLRGVVEVGMLIRDIPGGYRSDIRGRLQLQWEL